MMRPERWVRGWLGLPWIAEGRGLDGADCWGLVQLVLRHAARIEVDDWLIPPDEAARVAARVNTERRGTTWGHVVWREGQPAGGLRLAKAFDVAVMRAMGSSSGLAVHIGIVAGSNALLHTEIERGAHVAELSSDLILPRLIAIHRHASLT